MDLTAHFQMLARYNRIANERLYSVCAQLDDNEYRKLRAGSFGSILFTEFSVIPLSGPKFRPLICCRDLSNSPRRRKQIAWVGNQRPHFPGRAQSHRGLGGGWGLVPRAACDSRLG
jgi:hypothetical protein